MKEIQLISSQFPSGVAWLLNFFLEIDVLIYREDKIENTWNINNNQHILKEEQCSLKQWIPILLKKTTFSFCDDIAIRWSHSFPGAQDLRKPTILLTRDGRDAIYSYHKRSNFEENFKTTLHRLDTILSIPYPETWALHNFIWKKIIPKEKFFHISFEQIKTDPLPILKKMMIFLQIERTEKELLKAIEMSSFENAKKAEEEYLKNTLDAKKTTINRKGKIKEWEETMNNEDLSFFTGFPNEIIKMFNYETITEKEKLEENIKNYFFIHQKNDIANSYIQESLQSTKYSDWQEAEKRLLTALRYSQKNVPYILEIGKILVSIEWLKILYKNRFQKLDKEATEIFNLLLEAAQKMRGKSFLFISISRTFSAHGQRQASLDVLEIAKKFSGNSCYELTEIARIFIANGKILKAIKILTKIKNENWKKIVIKDCKTILKKIIKKTLLYDICLKARKNKKIISRILRHPKLPINNNGKVLIHLGCGEQNDARFINVDALPLPHIHYVKKVEKLNFFKNDYADLIYTCHTLEHISHQKTIEVLKEWRRVLKPGGTLRISVPNFDDIIGIYKEKNNKIIAIENALMGGQNFPYNFHKSVFNKEYLMDLLLLAGFKEVSPWDPKKSKYYSFDDWASRKIEEKYNISLNLEAIK